MGRVIRAERMGPAVVTVETLHARASAQSIRAQAERDAEAIRRDAEHAGYVAGNAAAAKLLFELQQLRSDLIERTQREATQVALLVAGELLGQSLRADPALVQSLLAPHLARMRRAQQLVLRLHPDDIAWLQEHPQQLEALCKTSQLEGSISLRADPEITRGGCVVESNLGALDARVETRLQLIGEALGLPADALEHADNKETP